MKTKQIVITVLLTVLVLVTILGIINYFTLFGYYMPHQRQVIDTDNTNDLFLRSEPQYIALTEEPLPPTIITLYPGFGVDNVRHQYLVIFESDNLISNLNTVPENFPLKTELKNGRFIMYVPFDIGAKY